MLQLIRGILTSITTSAQKAYRTFVAEGRVDETISGKIMQHYGYISIPPAGSELITLQFGNNSFSVAENEPVVVSAMANGDVLLYVSPTVANNKKVEIKLKGTPSINITCESGKVYINADNIYVGKDATTNFHLVTENFINNIYAYHVHASSGVPPTPIPDPPLMPSITTTLEGN